MTRPPFRPATLQSRLRYAIMPHEVAAQYDEFEAQPGCSVQAFCGICGRQGQEGALLCIDCEMWAFNHHWQSKPAREIRQLGFCGNDWVPEDQRTWRAQVEYALYYLRRAIFVAKEMERARRA